MYKYENDMLHELFKDMFVNVTDVHDLGTHIATTNLLYISVNGTVLGLKSFTSSLENICTVSVLSLTQTKMYS